MNNTTRETKTIELPICKKVVEYKTYITAGERRKVVEEYAKKEDGKPSYTAEDILFTILTVKFDDTAENITSRMLELHQNDYKIIDELYAKIFSGEDFLA